MANVTVNRGPVVPVEPPVESVTLTLTPREASSLRRLVDANMHGHSIANFVEAYSMLRVPKPRSRYDVVDDIAELHRALVSVPVIS